MTLQRLRGAVRPPIAFTLDGAPVTALQGDTLLTAILVNATHVRVSDAGDEPRAGFCWMGACQDCWVQVAGHGRVRACTTLLLPGMAVLRT